MARDGDRATRIRAGAQQLRGLAEAASDRGLAREMLSLAEDMERYAAELEKRLSVWDSSRASDARTSRSQ
jgi:hypothetical protein